MANTSNMGAIMKPLIMQAMKAASGKVDGKTKKKAEVKSKMKMSVKVKRG